jgi:cell division protein FtsI/penicillin-binding protein 2
LYCGSSICRFFSYDDYSRQAQAQQEKVREIPALRGMLLDRNDAIFAKTNMLRTVVLNPLHVRDAGLTAEVLSRVLSVDRAELERRIAESKESGRGFLWVKRKIGFDEGERVKQLKLMGVEIRDEPERTYPKGELLAHVIGGKDHEGKGSGGIEFGLDEELEGIPGTVRTFRDVTQHGYESVVETEPLPGKNIWLTIDERLQYLAERELKAAAEGCKCKSGSVVVLHPQTGDILAMASFPTYDPNTQPQNDEEMSWRLNQAIAAPFEPGSVFKVITLSAALETTRLGPESPINCLGGNDQSLRACDSRSQARLWIDADAHGAGEVFQRGGDSGGAAGGSEEPPSLREGVRIRKAGGIAVAVGGFGAGV